MNCVSSVGLPFNPILEDFLHIDDSFCPDIPLDYHTYRPEQLSTVTPTETSQQNDYLPEDDEKAPTMSKAEIRRERNRISAQKSRERKQNELDRLQKIDTVLNELFENLNDITPANSTLSSELKKIKTLCKTDKVSALQVLTALFLQAIKQDSSGCPQFTDSDCR